jgi:hypothetical protein
VPGFDEETPLLNFENWPRNVLTSLTLLTTKTFTAKGNGISGRYFSLLALKR